MPHPPRPTPEPEPAPVRQQPLALSISALSGAPARRGRRAAPTAQASLFGDEERLPNGEPARMTWYDHATGTATDYAQDALL